jgi:aminopeptidase N
MLLNDDDLTYAKIRLDERSLKTAINDLSRVEDSLARALIWGAAWDMTRDAEMTATDFVDLVLANIGQETDSWGISRIPVYAAQAVHSLSAPAHRPVLEKTWERGLRRLIEDAEPGSDQQLTFVRSYASAAHSEEAVADLEALLDGTLTFDGLAMDPELRWGLIVGLARLGRAGDRIDAERRGEGRRVGGRRGAGGHAQRDPAVGRSRVPGPRSGRRARAVRGEVPRRRGDALGAPRHPQGVDGPELPVPPPARLPRPARTRRLVAGDHHR